MIDLVNNYVTAAMTPPAAAGPEDPPAIIDRPSTWYEPFANILRHTTSLDWNFGEVNGRKGWLDLIPAGRQGPSYATRMNSFSWQNFYDRLAGGMGEVHRALSATP